MPTARQFSVLTIPKNHHAVAPDGLCANKLNLGDGGKNTPKLRNTRFNGQEQKMPT